MTKKSACFGLLFLTAILLGIACGYLLPSTIGSLSKENEPNTAATSSVLSASSLSPSLTPTPRSSSLAPDNADYFVIPPDAIRMIRVNLIDDLSLNKKECETLGLTESQIQEMSLLVDESISRWLKRESDTMQVIGSSEASTVIHIPSVDPEQAEQEWQVTSERIKEIVGSGLDLLFHKNLTDGNRPSLETNSHTPLLNRLTAGFGTLDRFIEVTRSSTGMLHYEILDVRAEKLSGISIDRETFGKLSSSGDYDVKTQLDYEAPAGRVAHLPLR